jgi:hypothetical protein
VSVGSGVLVPVWGVWVLRYGKVVGESRKVLSGLNVWIGSGLFLLLDLSTVRTFEGSFYYIVCYVFESADNRTIKLMNSM